MGIGNVKSARIDSLGGPNTGEKTVKPETTQSTTPPTGTEKPPEALKEGVGKKLNIPNC